MNTSCTRSYLLLLLLLYLPRAPTSLSSNSLTKNRVYIDNRGVQKITKVYFNVCTDSTTYTVMTLITLFLFTIISTINNANKRFIKLQIF